MKKAVIAWGRMNPVTIGHEKLVDKVLTVARRERAEPRIYLSHTQSPKKDPLQYKDKIAMAKKAFGSVVKQSSSRTLIQLMQELERAGFTEVTMVAGSDRVNEYDSLLNKYNGKEYTFDSIKVVSAGERDADAEGAAGMSATKLRQYAVSGDQENFMKGVPSKLSRRDAEKLYTLIRKGMMVEELIKYVKENKDMYDVDENSFTEDELDQEVAEYDPDELDEEVVEEEDLLERAPLTIRQRIAKSRQMKRLAPKLKRMRQVKKFRVAPTERLMQRARKMARNLFRKRFAGKKGEHYSQLKPSEKINIDRLIATKTPAIEKLAKRLLPKVRKAEIERVRAARTVKNETVERYDDVFEALFEATKTRQDPDIKDREGTQPARYHTGLAKSTKAARDAHFKRGAKMDDDNPAAYKPAPGDREAETKPSKWTKKYKDLFGEQDALARAKEVIKREKQADKVKHDRMLDRARTQDAQSTVRKAGQQNRGVSSSVSEALELSEKSMDALKKKAEKSGYSYGTLKKVYDRGVAAWRTGHRPGTTPQQWGYARVNAFIAKQKSGKKLNHDTDLANEYVPEGKKASKEEVGYISQPKNGQKCINCTMWREPNKCSAVAGDISPNGWCKWYQGGAYGKRGNRVEETSVDELSLSVKDITKSGLNKAVSKDKDKIKADLERLRKGLKKEDIDINEGINDPAIFKAVFLAGGPGSGKSFIVGRTALPALGFKVINSDEAFERALAKAGMAATPENIYSPRGQELRTGAKALTKKKMDLALAGRLGLVIDGTGKDLEKIMRQATALRKLGYDTSMIFVNTDEETALQRNRMRSRSLPDDTVSKMWKDVQKNIGAFQVFFGSSMFVVDNSQGSDVNSQTNNIYRKISSWSKRTPQNKAVTDWMKAQRQVNEEAPVIDGKKMHRLGSKPGSYKALVKRHLGARAAEKIDKSDGNKLVAKGKRTGNNELVRKGSFIKNVIAKEETPLDEASKDDEQAVHKMLNSQPAEKLLKVYKKLYRKEYPGTSKSELVSKIKSKVRNYRQAYELIKEETQLDESLQIERGAGYGTFLTAADLGIKIKAGYQDHPSVEEEHGAGEEGTDKLTKKYKKDTPGQ